MPSLSDYQSNTISKLLYCGDSGTGKTGSLVSLIKAGYRMSILDMDNGLDYLVNVLKAECPDMIKNVRFESVRDKFKPNAQLGVKVSGTPKAFIDAAGIMTRWSETPDEGWWGDNHFFVLDSLTALGKAAYDWAEAMNPTAKEPRTWYFTAQKTIENMISAITSPEFKTNAIVITHVSFKEMPDGSVKAYAASGAGSALGPTIPKYFNTLILAERAGMGEKVRRTIRTVPTDIMDLKIAALGVAPTLPLESGLATIVSKLKEKEDA